MPLSAGGPSSGVGGAAFGHLGVNDGDKYVVVDDSSIVVLPIELNPLGFNWLDEYLLPTAAICSLS